MLETREEMRRESDGWPRVTEAPGPADTVQVVMTEELAQRFDGWLRSKRLAGMSRRRSGVARQRSRKSHRRPGWGALWLAVKWGFLSGWRRDRNRAYLVSFGAGKAEPDVVVVENIGSGRS